MRYITFGAGGIGCAIGGRLFMAGRDVMLIARDEPLGCGWCGARFDGLRTGLRMVGKKRLARFQRGLPCQRKRS